jgi:hypothetical protein
MFQVKHELLPYASSTTNITLQYSGIWYEIDKYFAFFDIGQSCTSFRYCYPPNNKTEEKPKGMNFLKKTIYKGHRFYLHIILAN